jgi:hypothetical protein
MGMPFDEGVHASFVHVASRRDWAADKDEHARKRLPRSRGAMLAPSHQASKDPWADHTRGPDSRLALGENGRDHERRRRSLQAAQRSPGKRLGRPADSRRQPVQESGHSYAIQVQRPSVPHRTVSRLRASSSSHRTFAHERMHSTLGACRQGGSALLLQGAVEPPIVRIPAADQPLHERRPRQSLRDRPRVVPHRRVQLARTCGARVSRVMRSISACSCSSVTGRCHQRSSAFDFWR